MLPPLDLEKLEPYNRAFWENRVLDRVAVAVSAPRNTDALKKIHAWMGRAAFEDPAGEILDRFEAVTENYFHGGLLLPVFFPNLGPDAFAAFLGAKMNYNAKSSWIDWASPVLKDYRDCSPLSIRDDNPYYRKYIELITLAAKRSRGRYLVGETDVHGGFDALAALRGGPEVASMDILDNPDGVKQTMKLLFQAWKKVNDDYYGIVSPVQKATVGWMSGVWSRGKMFPVQNDFSCLLSPAMYREFLLDEITAEIEYLDCSIYHLDGSEALQHLDLLLDIPRLNAIQWVAGARFDKESIERWFPLYQKIQAAKKSIILYPKVKEIPLVLKNLKPEGLLMRVNCASEREAHAVLADLGWE